MLPRLCKLAEAYPVIADVRGPARWSAVELTRPGTLDPTRRHRRGGRVLPQGRPCGAHCGTFGNVLRFLPPARHREDLLEEGLGILEGTPSAAL